MSALLIFVKNPLAGQVKTRLAEAYGSEKALEIYHELLAHTRQAAAGVTANRLVFYSDFIDGNDDWDNSIYQKHLQNPSADLGERMYHAFRLARARGYVRLLIVGSDCPRITTSLLNQTFLYLTQYQAVIGPSADGGYYALGLSLTLLPPDPEPLFQALFLNKKWSHSEVANEAIKTFADFGLTFRTLPVLSDIDTPDDWEEFQRLQQP